MNLKTLMFLSAFVFLVRLSHSQNANLKVEKYSYSAKILAFQPGYQFTLSKMLVKTEEAEKYVRFRSFNAKEILSKFKVGDQVNIKTRGGYFSKSKKLPDHWVEYISMEQLISIESSSEYYSSIKKPSGYADKVSKDDLNTIFIERQIKELYKIDGEVRGLYLDSGELLYGYYGFTKRHVFKGYKVGDRVTSVSREHRLLNGEVRPIKDIKSYSIRPLTKAKGIIKSFLYKQNFAYVGLVLLTDKKELKLSFPSENAGALKRLADKEKSVTVYYEFFNRVDRKNPPGLYAAILDGDTVLSERPFWADPDGRHETEPVVYQGEIKKIVKNGKNKISMLFTEDALMEPNFAINQIRHLLKKGTNIEVRGEQRIKRPGEIYEKEYKIIKPKSIVINGKEYLLQQ